MKKVFSVNISEVKEISWKGRTIKTGIFKYPVQNKLKVEGVNIQGDDQADRSVHGGEFKAVYAYPREHYSYWEELYPNLEFHNGMFGENLTTLGMLENQLFIGDILEIGSTQLMVVQPRFPCYKLGIKFGTQKIVKDFYRARKPGYYLKIVTEGELEAGDKIEHIPNPDPLITIVDVVDIFLGIADAEIIDNVLQEQHLPPNLSYQIQEKI